MNRAKNEINHFTNLEHIWWGARSIAGQKRYDNKFKQFKNFCKPKNNLIILEIGCGDGEFTKRLIKLKVKKIIATDLTPKVIRRAKKEFDKDKKIVFKVDNSEKMKIKSLSMDIICGISILHHVNTFKALKECYRILKKNGQIFFTEPNLINPIIFLGLNTPFLRKRMEYSPDETALIRWRVQDMLEKIGFSEVKVINYDFLFPKTPESVIKDVERLGTLLEKTPIIKEISGSLIIWAKK